MLTGNKLDSLLARITAVALCLLSTSLAHATPSLSRSTFEPGARVGDGGGLSLSGTAGQPDAAPTSYAGSTGMTGGFWALFEKSASQFVLDSFTVVDQGHGQPPIVTWTTTSELDLAGFRLYRGVYVAGAWTVGTELTSSLITRQGTDSTGATYQFTDPVPYFYGSGERAYFIEDENAVGDTSFTGPALFYMDDTIAPLELCGLELSVFGPSIVSGTEAYFSVGFNEPVQNIDTSVFNISGPGTVDEVTPSAQPDTDFLIKVSATGLGDVTLSYGNPNQITDVVGNAFADINNSSGTVTFIDTSATQIGNRIADGDGALNDRFGASIAASGEILLVGSPNDDDAASNAGTVFVFERDSTSSFTEKQKLIASNATFNDRFGEAVGISGDWAVVGAPYADTAGSDSGTAYVFHREGGVWSEHSQLISPSSFTYHRFGSSVGISGNTIVVGAPLGYSVPGGVYRSGLAHVFEYDACNETWNETDILQASDATANDNYGTSVAIAGTRIVVGAPFDDDNGSSTGSAYLFTRIAGSWIETTKINHTAPVRYDYFGQSVAISETGTELVVGAPGRDGVGLNEGGAYVFERVAFNWSQTDELVASDATNYDAFGQSVGITTGTVIVGAYKDDTAQLDAGSAYVFTGDAGSYAEIIHTLPDSDDQGRSDNYGSAVAASGNTAYVGSSFGNDQTLGVTGSTNTGSAYAYRMDQLGP